MTTALLVKLPIHESLSVQRTLMGFDFVGATAKVNFKGKIHQKKIIAFLQRLGILIAG